MRTITTDDIPEALQKLLLEIGQTHQSLTVLHEGKPIVTISSAIPQKKRPSFGFMQGEGEVLDDIIAPVEQPWEVLQ
jgi:hypothetical protein